MAIETLNPTTGEVWRTMVSWTDAPKGTITVTYGHVAGIDALVDRLARFLATLSLFQALGGGAIGDLAKGDGLHLNEQAVVVTFDDGSTQTFDVPPT